MSRISRFGAAVAVLLAFTAQSVAQPQAPAAAPSDEIRAQLDDQLAAIATRRIDIPAIEARLGGAEGLLLETLRVRLGRDRIALLTAAVRFADAVQQQQQAGVQVDEYRTAAIETLQQNLDMVDVAWTQLGDNAVLPDLSLSAADQAAENRLFFDAQGNLDRMIALVAESIDHLRDFGVDVDALAGPYQQRVAERALNASVFLDMAQEQVAAVRAGLIALPGDTELTAKLSVAEARVARTAVSLERAADLLDSMNVSTSTYRTQLVAATGEITPELFALGLVRDLVSQWGRTLVDVVAEEGPGWFFRGLLFVVIAFVFVKFAGLVRTLVGRAVERSNASLSQLLRRMIVSTAANLVLAVGLLIALSQLGISLGPLLAGLGIAGFVIGFALQDSLSNFASGLMILFYRPYDVGDIVELGGATGKVEAMSLVNTTIHTFDNQRIIMPNSMIWGGMIKNVTSQDIRRVDMVFGVSYSDDIPATEKILRSILAEHELVLDAPEAVVKLHELADSSVNFVVRPWTKTENYWTVYWDVTRAVKLRFDAAGISIPFPQRDVHVIGQAAREPLGAAPARAAASD